MRVICLCFGFLMSIHLMFNLFQEKPKDTPKVPKVSIELQNVMLRAQKQEIQIRSELTACNQRNWQQDFSAQDMQIRAAAIQAFKEAGLDQKDYDLNMDTFEFVKKAPAPEPPKEEKKKP